MAARMVGRIHRPAPLLGDGDVLKACLASSPVPIRRTFIDYACDRLHTPTQSFPHSPLKTAPAASGRSMSSILDVSCDVPTFPFGPCAGSDAAIANAIPPPALGSQRVLASPPAWPSVTYKMSPVSQRAAWHWHSYGLMNADGLEKTTQGELEALSTATESVQQIDGDSSGDDQLLIFPTAELTLPSAGSDQHWSGTCRRCCFFPKGRCVNGTACEFCHYPHERIKTSKRTNHAKRREQRQQHRTNQQLASTVNAVPSGATVTQLEDEVTGERIVKLRLQDVVIGESQHLHGLLLDSSYVTCEVGPLQLARVGVQ